MSDNTRLKANIFAYIFKLSNMLQVYLDNAFAKDGLSAKQMFLMIAIHSFNDHYPTYKQVSDISGSSYQNVKQIALKLEKKGFLAIKADKNDKRANRLQLTKKSEDYWKKRDVADNESISLLFHAFSEEELKNLFDYINKLIDGIKRLDKR